MLEAIDRIASYTRDHDARTFADSGMARDAVVWTTATHDVRPLVEPLTLLLGRLSRSEP
jgi:hypothetical protein